MNKFVTKIKKKIEEGQVLNMLVEQELNYYIMRLRLKIY